MLIGSEAIVGLSPQSQAHLLRIPTIALDYPTLESDFTPTVCFTTAVYGIHRSGTAYRMDEVPIPLRAILGTDYPSDEDVLNTIARHVLAR